MSASQLWPPEHYQLLDVGNGRKLERFGAVILDRPCPAAERMRPQAPLLWDQAAVRIEPTDKAQQIRQPLPEKWHIAFERVTFELRLTPFGHVGVFPEHAANWCWLIEQTSRETAPQSSTAEQASQRVLNLFAYTGGASLLLAAHGLEVVHVDASAPSVTWARRNAELSGLAAAPIRWIVDDARTFVAREVRRGRLYDAIVLDPPSYGHSPKGKAWQIQRDLHPLIAECARLLSPDAGSVVLTGHSDDMDASSIDFSKLFAANGRNVMQNESGRLTLNDLAGRELDCGWYARLLVTG